MRKIPLGVSGRHLHLSQRDLETLFGKGYQLTKFKDLTHIAIECNYVESKLMHLVDEGYLNAHQAARVIKSHLSLENLIKFLKVNDLSKVKELHLLHLSDGNSDINIIENEIR